MKRLTAINYGVFVFDLSWYLEPAELLIAINGHFEFKKALTILMVEP